MGIFGKNPRPEKAPEQQQQEQQQPQAKRSPGPALKFFSVNGRRRKDSNDSLSTLNSTNPSPSLPDPGLPHPYNHQLGHARLGRSVDSLPLALSQHQSPGQSHRPTSSVSLHPRHAVSPLAQCASDATQSPAAAAAAASPSGSKAKAFNRLFRKTHRNTDSSASSSTLSVPQSTVSSGGSPKRLSRGTTTTTDGPSPHKHDEFSLKSFRSVSSPLHQQRSTDSDYAAKPAMSPLQTPPAIADADADDLPLHAPVPSYANKPRSSSVSSMPILSSSSTSSPAPSRPASPGWRGSVTASHFQQAKSSSAAARSSNTSLRTTPSSTSLAQMTNNNNNNNMPEPSSASSMPPPTPKSPGGSRAPSKLDLPLPTPSRVAPSKPLPSRRSSAVDTSMDVYNDYFSSPVSSPSVATTHSTKQALFGNAHPSPAARDQALRTSPQSELLHLDPSPSKQHPFALPGADDGPSSTTARPSPSSGASGQHPARSLSGSNLLSAASNFSSSVVSYINSWEEPLEGGGSASGHKPQPSASSNVSVKPSSSNGKATARERRKSKAMGAHAWGADSDSDSDSDDDSDQGEHQKASSSEGGRSDGGLQLDVKRAQSPVAASRQKPALSSSQNAAWESDSAVIKREEARKQALLAQSSPFTRSSFLPPQPVARPLQPTTNIQPSSHHQHKRSPSSQSAYETDKPRQSPTASRVSPHHEYQQYGQAPLDEGNLEILNSREGESALVDDDDDETPLARVTSHRRSQSDLCVPTIGRMSQLSAGSSAVMQPSKSAQKHASDAPEGAPPRASMALDSQQHHRQSHRPLVSKTSQDMHGRMQVPVHQQPSLSDLVHAYRNLDGHAPVTLSPPTLGGGPRSRGSQVSVSSKGSKRSFSAHDLPKPSLESSLGGPAGSSRMSIASNDSTSVHERMRIRHKDAMKIGAGLVQVDKPSGSLPPPTPTVRPSPAPQMVPSLSAGSIHQLQMPMDQMPCSPDSDAAPPGIDPGLWATLPPDQRLNLTMRSNAMMQMQMQQMQQMAAMQAQMQFAMQNMSAAGSSMGMPSSGPAMSFQQQPWGTGSIMGFPPLPAHASNMSTTTGARKSQAHHSFINQR